VPSKKEQKKSRLKEKTTYTVLTKRRLRLKIQNPLMLSQAPKAVNREEKAPMRLFYRMFCDFLPIESVYFGLVFQMTRR